MSSNYILKIKHNNCKNYKFIISERWTTYHQPKAHKNTKALLKSLIWRKMRQVHPTCSTSTISPSKDTKGWGRGPWIRNMCSVNYPFKILTIRFWWCNVCLTRMSAPRSWLDRRKKRRCHCWRERHSSFKGPRNFTITSKLCNPWVPKKNCLSKGKINFKKSYRNIIKYTQKPHLCKMWHNKRQIKFWD